MLRNEARVMEGLHSLGIEELSLHNVLKLNIQPSDSDYAVDIRSSAISVRMVFYRRDFMCCWAVHGNLGSYLTIGSETAGKKERKI